MDHKTIMVSLALDRPNHACVAVAGRGWVATVSSRAMLVPESEATVAEQLDKIAADIGAGAVIAGAYGHSPFREWIHSGVTRHLTTESRRCAFLSRQEVNP